MLSKLVLLLSAIIPFNYYLIISCIFHRKERQRKFTCAPQTQISINSSKCRLTILLSTHKTILRQVLTPDAELLNLKEWISVSISCVRKCTHIISAERSTGSQANSTTTLQSNSLNSVPWLAQIIITNIFQPFELNII